MNNTILINTANNLMVQRLLRSYLSSYQRDAMISIMYSFITIKRIANRSSVPDEAITISYLIENMTLGFSFRFRAVWYEGKLLDPVATHVVIEKEWDEADLGSPAAVSAAINDWLQAVTP